MIIEVNNFNVFPVVAGALSPVHTVFYADQGATARGIWAFLKNGDVIYMAHTTNFPTGAQVRAVYPDAVDTYLSGAAGLIQGVRI